MFAPTPYMLLPLRFTNLRGEPNALRATRFLCLPPLRFTNLRGGPNALRATEELGLLAELPTLSRAVGEAIQGRVALCLNAPATVY